MKKEIGFVAQLAQHPPISTMNIFQSAIRDTANTIQSLTELEQPLSQAAQMVSECLCSGHKLLVCGNGGSAADASHFATEFLCRFMGDRRPYPALSLTSEGSLLTAVGNDYAFEELFARQVWGLGEKGDILVVFTTSGKSRNILRAIEEANRKGLQSIAFLGKDGGFTKGVATIDLLVRGDVTARIQEGQKVLLHILCEIVEGNLPRA